MEISKCGELWHVIIFFLLNELHSRTAIQSIVYTERWDLLWLVWTAFSSVTKSAELCHDHSATGRRTSWAPAALLTKLIQHSLRLAGDFLTHRPGGIKVKVPKNSLPTAWNWASVCMRTVKGSKAIRWITHANPLLSWTLRNVTWGPAHLWRGRHGSVRQRRLLSLGLRGSCIWRDYLLRTLLGSYLPAVGDAARRKTSSVALLPITSLSSPVNREALLLDEWWYILREKRNDILTGNRALGFLFLRHRTPVPRSLNWQIAFTYPIPMPLQCTTVCKMVSIALAFPGQCAIVHTWSYRSFCWVLSISPTVLGREICGSSHLKNVVRCYIANKLHTLLSWNIKRKIDVDGIQTWCPDNIELIGREQALFFLVFLHIRIVCEQCSKS